MRSSTTAVAVARALGVCVGAFGVTVVTVAVASTLFLFLPRPSSAFFTGTSSVALHGCSFFSFDANEHAQGRRPLTTLPSLNCLQPHHKPGGRTNLHHVQQNRRRRHIGLAPRATRSPLDAAPTTAAPRSRSNVTLQIPPFFDAGEHDQDRRHNGSRDLSVPPPRYPSPLHYVHVVPMLSEDEAAQCLGLATSYAQQTKCWDRPDNQRHASYATCDFCVDDCPTLQEYLDRIGFRQRILGELSRWYGIGIGSSDNDSDNDDLEFMDLFCAHYVAKDTDDTNNAQTMTMDRLEAHRDGSLLSFTVLLSPPSDFEGGGTFFDALRDVPRDPNLGCLHDVGVVRPQYAGDAVLHTGKALHGAEAVTTGTRTVLVGFVSVHERWQRPGALAAACRDWGRMDVANWRCRRHTSKVGRDGRGWQRSTLNQRWLSSTTGSSQGRSDVRSYCPNFESVWTRADPGFQRLQKLRAEDLLLRTILLDEPREIPYSFQDGVFPSDFDDGDYTNRVRVAQLKTE